MSRIGKMPIKVPEKVKVSVAGAVVTVEGPKGSLTYNMGRGTSVAVEGAQVLVSCKNISDVQSKANYGTARAKINNMVKGVTEGWKKTLEMTGVGYTAALSGDTLTLTVGFSHDVKFTVPKEIKCAVEKTKIALESPNRDLLGVFAAKIRKTQPPEPYLGKGIRYSDEVVRRKQGKTAKK
jgi:large subunit ribosomal protein L6